MDEVNMPTESGKATRPDKKERYLKSGHAAAYHYVAMKGDQSLDIHRDRLLRLTAQLMVHANNLSKVLHAIGEDGDPRRVEGLLRELRHLHREIRSNLTYVFGTEGEDVFASYRSGA
jgi:C4-dicarboxylate-specific signal transduction histidine kinase